MERWEIRRTPTAKDPDRHLLLMRGGPADVAALLRRFGATLGRPTPYQGEDFNLSFVLHRLTPEGRGKIDAWLQKMAPPPASAPAPTPAPAPAPAPTPAPSAPTPAPPTPVPVPATPVPAPLLEPPSLPELPPIPSFKTPEPEEPPLVSLAPAPTPLPTLPALMPLPSAPPPTVPVEVALRVPLREALSFETLLVGAYNRFAHAAATSVVSSPGAMYNPLFLYGVPGTGKSHLLQSIGLALSKGLGEAAVLSTSGPRLSRAVDAALARKNKDVLDKEVSSSKALLIDDIHLMAVGDQNKEALAGVFKHFFDRQLQVVITSLYPPRALGALEEALKFSFSKGWSVDLKVPSPAVQKDLVFAASDRSGAGFGGDEIALLHERLSRWGFQDLVLWLKRLAALKKSREAAGRPAALQDLLAMIYDPIQAEGSLPSRPQAVNFTAPEAAPEASSLAVIVPKGQEFLGPLAASLFYEVGGKNGLMRSYRHALWDVYDPTVPFGVPFLIGEMCRRAAVARALVVGPAPETPLGPRAAELAHATRRILESLGVEMGWIPYGGLQIPAHYLNAHLDLGPGPVKP